MDPSASLPAVAWPAPRAPARPVDAPGSDERLARLVGQGDNAAFAAIDARYRPLLERYARSVVRDPHDAQDVVQCTLLAALRALRAGRRHAPLRPWLLRIAHNEAVSVLRRRRQDVDLDGCAAGVPSAADAAEARADLRGMLDDIRQLSDRQRSALVMRELSGLGYAEIARALDTTPVASRQLVCAARAALTFGRLLILPVKRHDLPKDVRLQPTW